MANSTDVMAGITIFIVLLIGVILVQPLGEDIEVMKTENGSAYNETVSSSTTTYIDLANNRIWNFSKLTNQTNGTTISARDYDVDRDNGRILIQLNGTNYGAYYTYYPDTYVDNTTARNLTDLVLILFVLGLIGAGVFYWVKSSGDML